jgi:hypothetical protein
MGKKDKKKKSKDPEKKAELQAKKEAKAEKVARKRFDKEARKDGGDDDNDGARDGDGATTGRARPDDDHGNDLDAILSSYAQRDKELTTPLVTALTKVGANDGLDHPTFPSPRANFSFTLLPNNDLLMFGGEYYNGAENVVYDDVYQWNPNAKQQQSDDDDDDGDDSSNSADDSDDENEKGNNDNGHKKRTTATTTHKTGSMNKHNHQGEWKQIVSPLPRPAARCAHSAVLFDDQVYVFGGELATTDQFHHYRDLWCYNIKSKKWREVKPLGLGPTPRSGHRCVVWRNFMILFGGFYEALRETPRWFNDLWVYNFSSNTWRECKYSKLATLPDARSGFIFGLNQASSNSDTAFLYGGFSKVKNPGDLSEGKIHTDGWSLNLKPLLKEDTSGPDSLPTWNRLTRKGEYPSPRVSASGVAHKHRLLVFGGVLDDEKDHHTVNSIFYNDLFTLDMDKRRWYTLGLKQLKQQDTGADAKKKSRRRKKKESKSKDPTTKGKHAPELKEQEQDEAHSSENENDNVDGDDDDEDEAITAHKEGEAKSSGWNLEMLQSNMSAFVDGSGNVVYEKIKPTPKHNDNANVDGDEGYDADGGDTSALDSSAAEDTASESVLSKPFSPPPAGAAAPAPLGGVGLARTSPMPRIKPALVIRGNILYVYGGILEVGDREVTLDDVWTLDISKRHEWECLYEGTMSQQVWKGVTSDDDESYISTGAGAMDDDDDDDSEDDDDEENEGEGGDVDKEDEGGNNDEGEEEGMKKKKKKKSDEAAAIIVKEIEELQEELSAKVDGNLDRLPQSGESMVDFNTRTKKLWSDLVPDREDKTAKELKTAGFTLARELYEEVTPTLERMTELQSKSKKKKKKSKDKDSTTESSRKSEREDGTEKKKKKKSSSKEKETIADAVPKDRRKNRAK